MGWEDESGRPTDQGGKRIRPLLCLFAAESLGGSVDNAMPAAVAVELVHNFSLVHDDVQDGDAERHGRPTAWKLHGKPQAINLGDYLHTKAVATLAEAPGPAEPRMLSLSILLVATARMIRGQWEDIDFEMRPSITVEDYVAMVAGKTGALLGAPLEMGAILAGAPPDQAAALGRWGQQVGIAFQAHDDYLGAWGDHNLTGKSNTNDIVRKKKSLPVVLGLRDATAARVITRVYEKDALAPADVHEVLAALEAAGCGQACRALAERHATEANSLLDSAFLDSATRTRFRQVADFLVARSS
jgi:geranylgeranyl diphosphate synthase type I